MSAGTALGRGPAGIERLVFLTSAWPFPADDGQKVVVAGYHDAARACGMEVEILLARPEMPRRSGMFRRALALLGRLNPFSGFHADERLPDDAGLGAPGGPRTALFVTPARLLRLACELRRSRPDVPVALLLNDAKWPMYLEALCYGLGLRRGGSLQDLLRGLLLPVTVLRELLAYRAADSIVVQTPRERRRLPWIADRVVVATNAVARPEQEWCGQESRSLAMHVNLTGRRARRYAPFVEHVWPQVLARRPDLRLDLFGPVGDTLPSWITAAPGVTCHGRVGDLDAFLAARRLLVMPLEHGTGVSNIVLRGLALDIPMVISLASSHGVRSVTPLGAAVRVASRPRDYIDGVDELLRMDHQAQPRAIGSTAANLSAILRSLAA